MSNPSDDTNLEPVQKEQLQEIAVLLSTTKFQISRLAKFQMEAHKWTLRVRTFKMAFDSDHQNNETLKEIINKVNEMTKLLGVRPMRLPEYSYLFHFQNLTQVILTKRMMESWGHFMTMSWITVKNSNPGNFVRSSSP